MKPEFNAADRKGSNCGIFVPANTNVELHFFIKVYSPQVLAEFKETIVRVR